VRGAQAALFSLDKAFQIWNSVYVEWIVEFTEEFETWWDTLPEEVQDRIHDSVRLLEERGPKLGRPYADAVKGSRHANMKELRFRSDGGVWRVAFDPERNAIVLVAGDKSGVSEKRF